MSTNSATPNILLCIADDLGEANVTIAGSGATRTIEVHNVDNSGTDIVGAMPNTSLLLRNGLYFSGAWAQPACSPTRASIYTGLHLWKHGVGSPMGNPVLDSGAGFTSLPNLLPGSYVSGLFGKWHLGGVSDAATPTDHGWDRHIGTLGGVLPDYYVWSVVDSATGYTQVALDANETSRSTPRCALHGMPQSGSMRMPQTRGLPRSPSTRRTIRSTYRPGIRCGNGRQSR